MNTDDYEPLDEAEKIAMDAIAKLLEHCDSVRIFVTTREGKNTGVGCWGGGNFYASMGYVREWMIREEHRAKLHLESTERDGDD